MTDLTVYSEELANIRKATGMSQTELAKKVGYRQQAISRIESKNYIPTLKSITDVAEALGYELVLQKKKQ